MSFINNYTSHIQFYAEEFYEGGIPFIYSIGKNTKGAIILKTDNVGNTIWQKEFSAERLSPELNFKKIIQINGQEGTNYVLSCDDGSGHVLMRIDADGNIIYSNQLFITAVGDGFLVKSKTNNDYYYVFSGFYEGTYGGTTLSQIMIIGFREDGQQAIEKYFYTGSASDLLIRNVLSHQNGITVLADHKGGKAHIIEFEYERLEVLLHKEIVYREIIQESDLISHDIAVVSTNYDDPKQNKYIVSGYHTADQCIYLLSIDISGTSYFYKFYDTQYSLSNLCYTNGILFLSITNSDNDYSRLHKINTSLPSDFSLLWSKQFNNGSSYGLARVTYNPISNYLTSVATDGELLLYTDGYFRTCITTESEYSIEQPGEITELFGGSSHLTDISNVIKSLSFDVIGVTPSLKVICEDKLTIPLKGDVALQSSSFYLQAVGSTGLDSTKGFHLRWLLKGALQNHLPKGNYATTAFNFNKPDDFVKIYRASYEDFSVELDLFSRPNLVSDSKRLWTYNTIGGNIFYVHFKDATKYQQARQQYDPISTPKAFIEAYGDGVIEIENKTKLSFSVTPYFYASPTANVKLELLSVESNALTAPKYVSLRQKKTAELINDKKLLSENIRCIRFSIDEGQIEKLHFEFYHDFIHQNNTNEKWTSIGQFALTKDTDTAFLRLEPESELVDANWLRFNDDAYVNIENYKDKWNGPASGTDVEDKIAFVVDKYITLSDDELNPTAVEQFSFVDPTTEPIDGFTPDPEYDPSDPDDAGATFEVSNLQLLQVASLDFHVARMLGLGTLDYNPSLYDGKYVYLAEYVTVTDLHDGKPSREMHHVYCSLPTTIYDERMSLPIDIKEINYGVSYGNGSDNPQLLTDEEGYTHDGRTRFLTLFNEEIYSEPANAGFFHRDIEFDSSLYTEPVYAGIEYKLNGEDDWRKPELPFDSRYYNSDNTTVLNKRNETVPILIPEQGNPLFLHREKQAGTHIYSSYGINWFSRATSSLVEIPISTHFPIVNTLKPPTNINAHLIRKERPLLLTSAYEQQRFDAITGSDKTLIRLTFDYNHTQELIDYHRTINGEEISGYYELNDNDEVFASEIQLFFRNEIPNTVSGKITSVSQDPTNELLSIVQTGSYVLNSTTTQINGVNQTESIVPVLPSGLENNFIGSILLIDEKEFVIHEVIQGGNNPKFKVFKRAANGAQVGFSNVPAENLEMPESGRMFVIVENMLSTSSWHLPAPIAFTVGMDSQIITINKEEVLIQQPDALTVEGHIQKFRGLLKTASITKYLETVEVYEDENDTSPTILYNQHQGIYRIEFRSFTLHQHYQHSESGHSVEWYNGVVRLEMIGQEGRPRKEYKVIKTENIGVSGQNLVLYILDPEFSEDNPNDGATGYIKAGKQSVAYYPGYKVYLHADTESGLTEEAILPVEEESEHYSIFGLRSWRSIDLYSKIAVPTLMFAKKVEEPKQPELPKGGLYATRPDFYGKSTYTFKTAFAHKPYSAQFNRASDIQILSAIYSSVESFNNKGVPIPATLDVALSTLLNENDEYYVNRWENLLGFDYEYDELYNIDGTFKKYPDNENGIALPLPDSIKFINSINAFIDAHNNYYNNLPEIVNHIETIENLHQIVIPEVVGRNTVLLVKDFLKEVIHNCFVPLTEIPAIYSHIKKESDGYVPIPKKQVIRDRNGNLLATTHPDFDMAPMMVKLTPNPGSVNIPTVGQNEVQFTDYGLDGASNAKYFYTVREFDLQMKTSEYSPILGPISLVNTLPPTAPEILKVTPILENRVLGVSPKIQFEINAYKAIQNIKKVNLYRAYNREATLSIRTMQLVKVFDVETESFDETGRWNFTDDFSDLPEIPFGDPLFYCLTVSRQIKYIDKDGATIIDYAPSEASKVVLTNVVENYSPESPIIQYYSEPLESPDVDLNYITLCWNKTAYKGKYHLYKMNTQGNWVKIHEVISNEATVYVHLEETELNNDSLRVLSDNGSRLYHHFKVIAENTSGMLSTKENILTIYNEVTWNDVGGIGTMIVSRTFRVR